MQGIKMIVIDSNIAYLEEIKRKLMLESEIDLVDSAQTASDGFNKVQAHRPTVIVFSHTLPDCGGEEFFQRLSAILPMSVRIPMLEMDNPELIKHYIHSGASTVMVRQYHSIDRFIELVKTCAKSVSGMTMNSPTTTSYGQAPLGNTQNQYAQPQVQYNQPQVPFGQQGPQYNEPTFAPNNNYNYNPPMQQNIAEPSNFDSRMTSGFHNGFSTIPESQPTPFMPGMSQRGGFRTIKQKIITLNSPKGGVGKTTLSKELGAAYSTVSLQNSPMNVCVVDLDLEFGDEANMLGKNPYPNISVWANDIRKQLLSGTPETEIKYSPQKVMKDYLLSITDNFKLLAAPTNPADGIDITGKEIEIIIESLKNCNFDVIILDTGNNISDSTYVAMMKASIILMIITMDITTINDTQTLLNSLMSSQVALDKIHLVLNRMPQKMDFTLDEIRTSLKRDIFATIPDCGEKVRIMNNNGKPMVFTGDNEFTLAIKDLANSILPVFNRKIDREQKQGLFSKLFSKLFSFIRK